MNIKHLKALIAIAEAGSITRAAEQIFIAQPALSQRLSALEDEVNTKLFIRSRQGVVLTDAGKKLYGHAKHIVKFAEEALEEMRAEEQLPSGTVSIGCQVSLTKVLGGRIIEAVQEKFPNIVINFISGLSGEIYKSLANSEIELGIVHKDVYVCHKNDIQHCESLFSTSTLEYVDLFKEEILFCSPSDPSNSEPQNGCLVEQLSQSKLVLPPTDHAITRCVRWVLDNYGGPFEPVAYSTSPDVIFDMIGKGRVASFLPEYAILHRPDSKTLNYGRIGDFEIYRTLILCGSPHADMHASTRMVREVIVDVAAQFRKENQS